MYSARRLRRYRGLARMACAWAALFLISSAAWAQGDARDKPAAEVLFRDALALVEAGSWAAGCQGFERSFALYPSRSTMIQIARCRTHEGKVATAWHDYERALRVEAPDQDAERQRELAAIATREAKAIEPRLPRLRVVIEAAPPGAEVRCDGQILPAGARDRAVPVDPGRHEVTVSAPGYRGVTRSVLLREGETLTAHVALVEVARPGPGWQTPTGILLAATGALGLGAGAATGVASIDLTSAVRARCGGPHCLSTDTASRQDVATAKTLAGVSTGTFIAGAALAVAGGALLAVSLGSGGDGGKRGAPVTGIQATFGPGGIALQGSFR